MGVSVMSIRAYFSLQIGVLMDRKGTGCKEMENVFSFGLQLDVRGKQCLVMNKHSLTLAIT